MAQLLEQPQPALAQDAGSTASLPAAAQVPTDSSESVGAALADPATAPAAFHIVQEAESLYAISVQHNIRLQRLMEWNQLTPDSVIKTGQKIWLEPVSDAQRAEPEVLTREQVSVTEPFHTVANGETMFGISYKYNIRLSSFMSWNNFTEKTRLKVGQKVYVVDPVSIAQ